MAQNIILKRSAVAGRVPDTGSLNFGELAVNTLDGKIYFKKSGSVESIETIVTTDSITSGSVTLSDDLTIQRDIYLGGFLVSNGDIDAGGDLSGSGLQVNDTLKVNHESLQFTGSAVVTGSFTVLGEINATQFNINIISSSVLHETGSLFINGDVTASAFVGDGSKLTNLNLDSELPRNGYDYNIDDVATISDFNTGSTKYIIDFRNEVLVGTPVGQITYIANSSGNAQIVPGSDKIYLISEDVEAGYITADGFDGNIVGIGNPTNFSSSLDYRIKNINTNTTNAFATTGSNTFNGTQTITGSLFISGTTELGGNIVPKSARGASLGTVDRPFSDIFVSSGSINIASDTPGAPNTTLSNVSGNILISAGGIQLLGTGSFNAPTASFGYLSGSFTHIGSQYNIGNTITTGSLGVSGSTIMIGNNTMTGNTILSGSIAISGSQTFVGVNTVIGNSFLTGSLNVTGSTTQIGNNSLIGNTLLSGTIGITGNATLTGSLYVSGTIVDTDRMVIGDVKGDDNNITVAGTDYNSQLVISNYGNDYVGQLILHRHSTEIQPILVSARSNSDDDTDTDVTPGMALLQIAATGWAGTDYKEFANIVFSADDADGITIDDGSSPGKIDFNVSPDGDVHTNNALTLRSNLNAEFNGLIKANGVVFGANYPTTSKGQAGDLNGMISSDGNYIYYCFEDYISGTNNIWKRVQLSNSSW